MIKAVSYQLKQIHQCAKLHSFDLVTQLLYRLKLVQHTFPFWLRMLHIKCLPYILMYMSKYSFGKEPINYSG